MPVRLIQPYSDQPANTLYWGAGQTDLIANGIADMNLSAASDYGPDGVRRISAAAANTIRTARVYRLQLNGNQTLTLGVGDWRIEDVLTIVPEGTGTKTITPGPGVTINGGTSSFTTSAQWKVAQFLNIGPNTWVAVGTA